MHKSFIFYILFLLLSTVTHNQYSSAYAQISSKLQKQDKTQQTCLHSCHYNKPDTLNLHYASHGIRQGALLRRSPNTQHVGSSDHDNPKAPARSKRTRNAACPSPTSRSAACSCSSTHNIGPATSFGNKEPTPTHISTTTCFPTTIQVYTHNHKPATNRHTRHQAKIDTCKAETTPQEVSTQHNSWALQSRRSIHQEHAPIANAPTASMEIRTSYSKDQVNPRSHPRISEPRGA